MRSIDKDKAARLIEREMAQHHVARAARDRRAAWRALERAHILAQPFFALHLASHRHMFGYAIALGDYREAAGQIFRLALVPLGSLTGRLPAGNTGRARVSAFRAMPVPPDLAELISTRDKSALR